MRGPGNGRESGVCHRFTLLNGEEADRVVDWLRAVRRALAAGMAADGVAPPSFARPGAVPFEAIDCYPGAESSVIVAEGSAAATQATQATQAMAPVAPAPMASPGELARIDLVWGIEVPWQKGLVFNARIESALSGSGMWRTAMEDARCIVPVRAFYETRNVEAPSGRRPRYRFSVRGSEALLLAGLRIGDRFALVTCDPDAVVGAVHTRMPLALTASEALAWLDGRPDAAVLLQRHLPVPLIAEEEPAPARRPANPDQMSLF